VFFIPAKTCILQKLEIHVPGTRGELPQESVLIPLYTKTTRLKIPKPIFFHYLQPPKPAWRIIMKIS